MTRFHFYYTLVLAVLLATTPHMAAAQGRAGEPKCAVAVQVASTGGRTTQGTMWRWEDLSSCPEKAAEALAAVLRHSRVTADNVSLGEIVRGSWYVRDGRLFQAAIDVAEDRRASATARVASFVTLVHQLTRNNTVDLARLNSVQSLEICPLGFATRNVRPYVGESIPSQARERARTAASQTESDSTAAPSVRTAARCVLTALRVPQPGD